MHTTSQKTILLVEDEPLIAMAEKMTLERNGYTVVTANTGEKAVETARNIQEIDLILMDIDLGSGIRGTDAASTILSERDLPLAFLSSHTEQAVVDETEGITSYGYIVKNSGNTVLLASIRMAFKLHEAHEELTQRKEHLHSALAREEHANELLLEKSEELERYFSSSLDMLCIASTEGEFLRLNPEWENALGYSVSEMEGRRFIDFVHPDDRDATLATLAQLENGNEILSFENRYRCKDGSYRWIEWRSRPVGSKIYATARDLTERKRAQEELERTSAYYKTLIEKAPDGVALLNREGMLCYASPTAIRIFGYEGFAGEQLVPDDLTHPDDLPKVHDTIDSIIRDPSRVPTIEYRFKTRDDSWRWIESTFSNQLSEPGIEAIIINFRDITDRKEAETTLETTERRFQTIVNSMREIVFTLDSSGRHTGVYGPWVSDYGLTPEHFLGKNHEEILGANASTVHKKAIEHALAGKFTAYEWIAPSIAPSSDGSTYFETSLAPIVENDGTISGVVGVGRDITNRKRAEKELYQQESLKRLLMTVAAEMIDVPLNEVDDRIDWMLAELGAFSGFDRVFVFRNDFDRGVTTNTHEWCAPGITSEIDNLQAVPLDKMPRILDAHGQDEAFVVPSVADLSQDDSVRALLDAQGVKSTLLLPLTHEGINIGFIGFDAVREERRLSQPIIDLLRFAARFITNTETRRAGEEKQRAAERVIRESEERFRELLNGIQDVPVQGFGSDGIVHYWNRASEELYGYPAEEAVGENVLKLLIPRELHPTIEQRISLMTTSGQPLPATEDWILRKDGTRVLVRTTHAIVRLPAREAELFSIDQDVTEQRKMEDDIRRLLHEKEMMLKEVQHRIKNTMHTMGSLLSLHSRTVQDPNALAALDDARRRFTSMEVLYDQLYRTDVHTRGSVSQYLEQLIYGAVNLFPAGHTISTIIKIEDVMVEARQLSSLGIIVNELVTNAMKYAFRDHPEPELRATGRLVNDRYTLVFEDNGPASPESFDRTTPSSFGITMVRALVEQLEGTIRFEHDHGVRITIDFALE